MAGRTCKGESLVSLSDFRDLGNDSLGVESVATILHGMGVANDPLFIDDEIRSPGITEERRVWIGFHDAVLFDRIPRKVIEQWIGQSDAFGKCLLRSDVIDANTHDLGVKAFELGKIQLESQYLRASDAAEGAYEEKQQHMLLPLITRQAQRLAYGAE